MEACDDFVFSIKFLVVIYENIDMNIQYFNLTDLVRLFLQYSDLLHIRMSVHNLKQTFLKHITLTLFTCLHDIDVHLIFHPKRTLYLKTFPIYMQLGFDMKDKI